MPQTIREVMTPDPKVLLKSATVKQAAELMRDDDIGDVIVVNGHKKLYGILTDRDIAVRCGAEGADPDKVTLEEIATKDVTTLSPDATIDLAVALMREKAIRRIPVVEDNKPIGIVSLGDLAIEKDPTSALADISAAPPDPAVPSSNGSGGGMGRTLPAAAAGAGVILAFELLRNRSKKRSLRVAAKRLKKTGKKLRRTGDKAGSDATQQAAKYATAALKEIRNQGKKMRRKGKQEFVEAKLEHKAHSTGRSVEQTAKDMSKRAEAATKELSKRAEKKAQEISKKAEAKAKEVSKKAERKAREISKKAEHKAGEVREMVGAGRR
ncbi:MAG TPA: CBS domain-containing protein [Actinomycetota bacterium]|nr:CBS domain-containing protein [Actinomycetota bacterium]